MTKRPWSPNNLVVHFTAPGSVSPAIVNAPPEMDELELATAKKWACSLLANLEVLGEKYAEANSAPSLETEAGESRQLLMSTVLRAVGEALKEMPAASKNPGLAVLHDLEGALLDLHTGKLPPLLQPRDVRGGPTTINTGFVRRHAIACVRILMKSGLKETPACRDVAAIMRKLGYVGRKKGPFSTSALTEWIAVLDDHDHRFLKKKADEVEATIGAVFNRAQATGLVTAILSDPFMLSKSGKMK